MLQQSFLDSLHPCELACWLEALRALHQHLRMPELVQYVLHQWLFLVMRPCSQKRLHTERMPVAPFPFPVRQERFYWRHQAPALYEYMKKYAIAARVAALEHRRAELLARRPDAAGDIIVGVEGSSGIIESWEEFSTMQQLDDILATEGLLAIRMPPLINPQWCVAFRDECHIDEEGRLRIMTCPHDLFWETYTTMKLVKLGIDPIFLL